MVVVVVCVRVCVRARARACLCLAGREQRRPPILARPLRDLRLPLRAHTHTRTRARAHTAHTQVSFVKSLPHGMGPVGA